MLNKNKLKIAVVGLGYVGFPLALEFARKGVKVIGIEIDPGRLEQIKRKKSYITDISGLELKDILDRGKFSATADFSRIRDCSAVLICVPTPLKRKYLPDISFIRDSLDSVAKNIKPGALVILESTTYPGTTEEEALPIFKKHNLRHGKDFYLCFSPERIDPGNKKFPLSKIPKVVGGINPKATQMAVALYKMIFEKVVPVSSACAAETVKLLENTFRLINIALIDELAMMCHKMKIDIWEVVSAASTKPFGFMPFYPGPGVGGHCLDKKETVFIKEEGSLKAMEMPEFMDYLQGTQRDDNIEALSFDPLRRKAVFKRIVAASARPYSGQMVSVITEDGRNLKVTDLHPMFIFNNDSWQIKYAKDLQKGDMLPICLKLPDFSEKKETFREIDIIENIRQKKRDIVHKVRVRPVGFSWKEYASEIKSILRTENKGKLPGSYWDYLSDNILPLKYFYALEKLIPIDRYKVQLVTGRGPSCREFPGKIILNNDFCRLIGYYLSEGCFTRDKSGRIRFSFNRDEKEYISDVIGILHQLGVRSSVYESKRWHTSCIKVSSDIFSFLICEILECGTNCYNMRLPEQVFSFKEDQKMAVLSGIFRGDACVEHFFGKRRYRKNQKEYIHNVNTASISFFTSSKKLFQQLIILIHDLGIIPTFKKRKYSLSIFGYNQLEALKNIFAGKKKEIIDRYLELNKNRPCNKTFKKEGDFATVKIKEINFSKGDTVYSLETLKPHSFVTSYGIAVHNCIPKDPLYLHWKAKRFGFNSRFIRLASEVIDAMPEYVADRVQEALALRGHRIKGVAILVVGVTYKKDVRDLRKSPAIDIIKCLKAKGCVVSYFDPLIPYLKISGLNLKSVKPTKKCLGRFACVVIATDHARIDYQSLLKGSKLIFDTRNVYQGRVNHKVVKL